MHCPSVSRPRATATPSLLRTIVESAPAETIGRIAKGWHLMGRKNVPKRLRNMQSLGPTPQILGRKLLNKDVKWPMFPATVAIAYHDIVGIWLNKNNSKT